MSLKSEKNEMNIQSKKRLLKDIKDIYKSPLHDQGIYYTHDDKNMKKGYAVIFGPSDTLYQYGAYFFELTYPHNYPFAPPKVIYMTNDGKTRFNPNLYRNGKVCISILNTWKGEQWTSCQSIRSVLLTLITLLHNKPLLNEPGFTEDNKSFKPYNDIIKYKNYEIAIYRVLNKALNPPNFSMFYPTIKKYLILHKKEIEKDLNNMKNNEINGTTVHCPVYNMNVDIDYTTLYDNIMNLIK
tara:strand:+ start:676 stop:1395 length:720 start_codon:yes stop_codon:yes gene_type:complete